MYAKVNDISIFYEKVGRGQPLLLVHGNGEDHRIFDRIHDLSQKYTLYLIDLRNHGKSSRTKVLTYDDMADDLILFIKQLNLSNVAYCGFSDGAIIGLKIAIKSNVLSRLIICGANCTTLGIKNRFRIPITVGAFITQNAKLKLMVSNPLINNEDLQNIKIPTLVLAGSRDVIRSGHTKKIAKHIPYATLMLQKGKTHSNYVVHKHNLSPILHEFLK